MTMAMPDKREPKVEWQGSYQGIPVYTDESLPKGTVQFRDHNHRVIGTIEGVGHIRIGGDR